MRAISLWQPWADAIFRTDEFGYPVKIDETRGWPTRVRGWTLIHAAKTPLKKILTDYPHVARQMSFARIRQHELALGCIIGMVDFGECRPGPTAATLRSETQQVWGDYREVGDDGRKRFAFELRHPLRFGTPLVYPGKQGFFDVPITNLLFDRWKESGSDGDRADYDMAVQFACSVDPVAEVAAI